MYHAKLYEPFCVINCAVNMIYVRNKNGFSVDVTDGAPFLIISFDANGESLLSSSQTTRLDLRTLRLTRPDCPRISLTYNLISINQI